MGTEAAGLTIEAARDRLQAVLASIAKVESELAVCASSPAEGDKTARVDQLKTALNDYIASLKSLHGEVTTGGIVKDPASVEDKAHVEIPVEVVDYLDQGKNPDEAMRLIFGSVLKRAQEVKGKAEAMQAFSMAVMDSDARNEKLER